MQPTRTFVVLIGIVCGVNCGTPPDGEETDSDVGLERDGVGAAWREPTSSLPYTVVALPHTQYCAAKYPAIFQARTNWIVEQWRALNIAFVVHEGDLVDADDASQWNVASEHMEVLADGRVPYVLSMGNHDYDVGPSGWPTGRSTLIDEYFWWLASASSPGFAAPLSPPTSRTAPLSCVSRARRCGGLSSRSSSVRETRSWPGRTKS